MKRLSDTTIVEVRPGEFKKEGRIHVFSATSKKHVYAQGRDDGFKLEPDEAWELAQALQKHAYECGYVAIEDQGGAEDRVGVEGVESDASQRLGT